MKGVGVGTAYYEIEVYDKNGKLIDRKRGKAESILDNWMRLFMSIRDGSPWMPKDTNGNSPTISSIVFANSYGLASAGDDSYGIQVGTGTTAVDKFDYCLESKIPHGSSSGQLSYGETSSYSAGTGLQVDEGMQRSFDNNSGADITINEIGMVLKVNDGSSDYYIMVMRDVISATTVPNGGRVTIKYWFRWNPS